MENGRISWRYKGRSCGVEIADYGDICRLTTELKKLAEDLSEITRADSAAGNSAADDSADDYDEFSEEDGEIADCMTLIRCALSMYFDRVIGRNAKLEMFAERDTVGEYLEALVSFTQFTNRVIDKFIENGERLIAQTKEALAELDDGEA